MSDTIRVERFQAPLRDDFFAVHAESCGAGWCFCVAWWVETWDGWGKRTAAENRALRDELCGRGEYDGYLLYVGDAPVGWCQVGPRDRLAKLRHQFSLAPEPGTWAVTCFQISPGYRRRGLAARLLDEVLVDLRDRGVRRVEAFPRPGKELDDGEAWTGPESLYLGCGFTSIRVDESRHVYALDLAPAESDSS